MFQHPHVSVDVSECASDAPIHVLTDACMRRGSLSRTWPFGCVASVSHAHVEIRVDRFIVCVHVTVSLCGCPRLVGPVRENARVYLNPAGEHIVWVNGGAFFRPMV